MGFPPTAPPRFLEGVSCRKLRVVFEKKKILVRKEYEILFDYVISCCL